MSGKSSKAGGKSGKQSATKRYQSLEKANRTWHSKVAKSVQRARKAAGS